MAHEPHLKVRPRCGRCGSPHLRPSTRGNPLQRLLFGLIGLQRYACINCFRRGWHFGRLPRAPEPPSSGLLGGQGVEPGRRDGAASMAALLPLAAIGMLLVAGAGWFALIQAVATRH